MICKKCGNNQPDNAQICSVCNNAIHSTKDNKTNFPIGNQADNLSVEKHPSTSLTIMRRLDTFCKAEVIVSFAVIILLLIAIINVALLPIIFSVIQLAGLITALLIHKNRKESKLPWLKHVILTVVIFLIGINIVSYSWSNNKLTSEPCLVSVPYSSRDCVGKSAGSVKKDFSAAGFTNIVRKAIEDLDMANIDDSDKVDSVSINGISNFETSSEFDNSAQVIISYHSLKKIAVPISSEEIKTMDSKLVADMLKEAGFCKISVDEKYDLDPDMTNIEFKNTINIDGFSSFKKTDTFFPDADISLVTHRPYEKYTLKINIDFTPNLFFSTYDVNFKLDGHSELLEHGTDAEFEYRIKPGTYTLTFTSNDSDNVCGTVDLALSGDTEAGYKISCTSEEVNVETLYVENKSLIGENEAMAPLSASDCSGKNYTEIEKSFIDAGFTNIETSILYDIVWGWTKEGEVDSVTIGDKSDFSRGDVFANNIAIVIIYHMKEEDNPDKKHKVEPTPTPTPTPTLTIENSSDFAELMKITDQTDSITIKKFVDSHIGNTIEFDGCIALMMHSRDWKGNEYNTRFDISVANGDYSGRLYGPLFAFEDVGYYDMHVSGSDSVSEGDLFHITAKIQGFSEEGNYIILKPISLIAR